jgi:hypothetical protein
LIAVHDALTAYERMREEYRVRPADMPFEWYVEQHPFVFKRPDVFMACRPVISDAPTELIAACNYQFPSEFCDCWSVGMIAGNLAKAWEFMPWFLPLMCFQRALDPTLRLRFYRTASLQRLTRVHANFNLHVYASA